MLVTGGTDDLLHAHQCFSSLQKEFSFSAANNRNKLIPICQRRRADRESKVSGPLSQKMYENAGECVERKSSVPEDATRVSCVPIYLSEM